MRVLDQRGCRSELSSMGPNVSIVNIMFSYILLNANINGCSTALDSAISLHENSIERIRTLRLLLNTTEHETDIGLYYGSVEGFSICQQALDPFYYRKSLEVRITTAVQLAEGNNQPETLRLALGTHPPLPNSITGGSGETLLSAVAGAMGKALWDQWEQSEDYNVKSIGMNPKEATTEIGDLLTRVVINRVVTSSERYHCTGSRYTLHIVRNVHTVRQLASSGVGRATSLGLR